MKKIWIILSLVVISLFVAACGASTGEATRFKGFGGSTQKVPTINPDVMKARECTEKESCGYLTKDSLKKSRLHYFADNPNQESCDQICSKLGYDICLESYAVQEVYIENVEQQFNTPVNCGESSGSGPVRCRCL